MQDILREFLEEGQRMFQVVPFDFFPNPEEMDGNNGILPLFYTRWAASESLLLRSEEIALNLDGVTDFCGKIVAVRNLLGEQLLPAHFSRVGNSFAQSYYRPGWGHCYLRDFGDAFPEIKRFEDVPDTPGNLARISAVLTSRLEYWRHHGIPANE